MNKKLCCALCSQQNQWLGAFLRIASVPFIFPIRLYDEACAVCAIILKFLEVFNCAGIRFRYATMLKC